MFCSNCGKKINENADICLHCGVLIKQNNNVDDTPNTALNIISLLWPVAGLILYLSMKNNSPIKAKSCGKYALIGVAITIGIFIISMILGIIAGLAA